MRIVIVDCRAGDLRSVVRAAARLGYDALVSSWPRDVEPIRALIAIQFHPEKSGELGLRLYRNFLAWAERKR